MILARCHWIALISDETPTPLQSYPIRLNRIFASHPFLTDRSASSLQLSPVVLPPITRLFDLSPAAVKNSFSAMQGLSPVLSTGPIRHRTRSPLSRALQLRRREYVQTLEK